jgi:hypothetical protein
VDALELNRARDKLPDVRKLTPEVTEWDRATFAQIISTELSAEQIERIVNPPAVYPKQRAVLAVHWHPEFIPIEYIRQRIRRMFPNAEAELIIPTQHNVLMEWGPFAGVEIDCYSAGFNRKVQLLTHFAAERVRDATVLKAMLEHTHKYRSSQLNEFIDSILEGSYAGRVTQAAAKTGASEDLVQFVRVHVAKIKRLIEEHEPDMDPDMLKNKLLRNYFNALRSQYDAGLIQHALFFLQAVKKIVKRNFTLTYFYRTSEVIEEVRACGGGIIIPHPEQFWPILLADYDVDGIEVWNPQSQEYTEFLVDCVVRQNRQRRPGQRSTLITMGDDTHFGEKVIDPAHQDASKAGRELGVQPAWDDLNIRKSLIVARADRHSLIEEYKARLGSRG